MHLDAIIAAADESDEGRRATLLGADLASRSGARLVVLRIVSPPPAISAAPRLPVAASANTVAIHQLERWIGSDLATRWSGLPVEYAVRPGLPQVEIGRHAEEIRADILVLGRKHRSTHDRLLLGDTADAVARRSQVPCLFTSMETGGVDSVLVALDGSERGLRVYREAAGFAGAIGAQIRAVFVEPLWPGEPDGLAEGTPDSRGARLRHLVESGPKASGARDGQKLVVRRGDPVSEILQEVALGADVLVVGFHRGGPAGVYEGRSVARRLVHTAPCSVLTIPL